MNEDELLEQQLQEETPVAAPEPESPSYVTRDDLNAFAETLLGRLGQMQAPRQAAAEPEIPDVLSDPAGYARYVADINRQAVREEWQLQQQQQRIVQDLGGDEALLAPYSPQQRAAIAADPHLAAVFKRAAANAQAQQVQQAPRRAVPRSEPSFIPDEAEGLTAAEEAEAKRALSGFRQMFPNVTLDDIKKDMIAQKRAR